MNKRIFTRDLTEHDKFDKQLKQQVIFEQVLFIHTLVQLESYYITVEQYIQSKTVIVRKNRETSRIDAAID